jgi:hypothetical protein
MARSRIYEDLIARGVVSRSRTYVDVGARNKSVGEVVPCEAPNGRGNMW